jgi:hypothetical protein
LELLIATAFAALDFFDDRAGNKPHLRQS